jgi:hypothetical protein
LLERSAADVEAEQLMRARLQRDGLVELLRAFVAA